MDKVELARQNYLDERNSALMYRTLSEIEKDEKLAEVYKRLAQAEDKHAEAWADRMKAGGGVVPEFKPVWRTRVLIWLARKMGPGVILPAMQNMEMDGASSYIAQGASPAMAGEEQSHNFMLRQIARTTRGGMEGAAVAQLEGRHRSTGGNALRAAVLGANDGLVSNLSLVMGIAGATLGGKTVLITGLAGLLAGAISMALGEWLSVQSSRELYQHQIQVEEAEIESNPEEEAEELALIYQARGLKPEQAKTLADSILANKESGGGNPGARGTGAGPQGTGGFGLGSRNHFICPLCHRSHHPGDCVHVPERDDRGDCQHRLQRGRVICPGGSDHAFHRSNGALFGISHGDFRTAGSSSHIWNWPIDRGEYRGIGSPPGNLPKMTCRINRQVIFFNMKNQKPSQILHTFFARSSNEEVMIQASKKPEWFLKL